MNILIVGNGFDLSHYLPTKYDHFMMAMGTIEKWDIANGEMSFDDLFGSLYEKEDYFFGYTKAMYDTDQIKISVEQVIKLKKKLEKNVWYQYFFDHVKEIKTWIDFEQKINEALILVGNFLNEIEEKFKLYGKFNYGLKILEKSNFNEKSECYYITKLKIDLLETLKICISNQKFGEIISAGLTDLRKSFIDESWYKIDKKEEYGFSSDQYLGFLYKELDSLIKLFNDYLVLVINELEITKNIQSPIDEVEQIYSFNYTKTFQRLYAEKQKINYLHGRLGEDQNIVLGISNLTSQLLIDQKAYGFTKYHQKLLKNTDYSFLHDIKEKLFNLYSRKEKFIYAYNSAEHMKIRSLAETQKLFKKIEDINRSLANLNGKIIIWGHSLDRSDINYIKEIFELNQLEKNFEIVIYYYNSQTKFELLANLLNILEQEKVEIWMKKGWLKFESNPNIVELNNIKPVELPKIAKA
ncbi:hypothetical protein B9T25_12220 [Acinetobacter sp. ANC 4470]|uniref:AbiH family protein n=1 Tax=Acinetobacter sp. ANC 4470 TaxID=1977881 RepID=UPI000A344C45|nr:AbiH family protein [Acinetobacter sp. ANC 4470]OTG65359.1 hypothetical protein B9T25_12220 [Acinetobacter sp. ANC 4470]